MSKYDRLEHYLKECCVPEIRLSFSEIERIVGFSLPRSAYTYPMWWANGGHTQAYAWLNAGYIVKDFDLAKRVVLFCRSEQRLRRPSETVTRPDPVSKRHELSKPATVQEYVFHKPEAPGMIVCGYEFSFLQQLIPVCEKGAVKEYYPQEAFDNRNHLPLLSNGHGAFCKFSIDASAVPGVYLWVVNGKIIYIGETVNLQQRFNMGYGNISPRNCYLGGQSTNCKMNKVVMECYKKGQPVSLYFHQTKNNKQVELDLLRQITTPYNVKDN